MNAMTKTRPTKSTDRPFKAGEKRKAKLVLPALRRVWFSQKENADEEVINEADFGGAPFALLVDYVPPKRGVYRVKLQVKPRDDEAMVLISRHGLKATKIFTDKAAEAADDYQAEMSSKITKDLIAQNIGYVWSHRLVWDALRYFAGVVVKQKTVTITFGTLLDGIEIKGPFDHVRRVVREVTMAIDKIGAGIDAGRVFDIGETRIFAPGARRAVADKRPRTPPSEWGQ